MCVFASTQVEQFWRFYSHLIRPGDLSGHSDFHLFKEGIKPMWEVTGSAAVPGGSSGLTLVPGTGGVQLLTQTRVLVQNSLKLVLFMDTNAADATGTPVLSSVSLTNV